MLLEGELTAAIKADEAAWALAGDAATGGQVSYMYALYVCLTCMPYMHAVYACLISMPYMYVSYACLGLVSMPRQTYRHAYTTYLYGVHVRGAARALAGDTICMPRHTYETYI